MAATTSPTTAARFEGAPDDPLLRAEIAKREQAQQSRQNEAEAAQSSEHQVERGSTGHNEGDDEAKEAGSRNRNESTDDPSRNPHDSNAESHEKSLAQQCLLRSILCTRTALPPAESVSDGVLQAVLVGDTDGLTEASRHERLKGVGVALRADDRRRTALHMAIGTKNARMVRALMRWRHELNRSLDDELDALDHRRDMFVQGVTLAPTNATAIATARGCESASNSVKDVERFAEWLFEERRRLVRVTELRCEENWHKAMAARDDKGRTPVHWAASVNDADSTLLQTLLTTGRADLSARDTTAHGTDASIMAALKAKLQGASSDEKSSASVGHSGMGLLAADRDGYAVFPRDDEFHRRTGKIRRRKRGERMAESKAGSEGEGKREERNPPDGESGVGMREGPSGKAACAAKVKWFCGALASTAEKLSGRSKGRAEAFLLSVFEDFDRSGDGTLSIRQFREALRDVNITVSEQTLLDMGLHFRAPTSKDHHKLRQRDHRDSKHRRPRGIKGASHCALVEISYVPLMDVVFGRKSVRAAARGDLSEADGKSDNGEHRSQDEAWQVTEGIYQPDTSSGSEDEEQSDDDCSFVDLRRLRAARTAAIEATDALGRPPLFLAAASGAVAAAKTIIRHGAASAVTIDGTSITAHSVAPSLLMKRVLAAEARRSLDRAIAARANGGLVPQTVTDTKLLDDSTHHVKGADEGEMVGATDSDAIEGETRRMEVWVSTLAESELASTRTGDSLVDEKTSLHLAAAAGLPGAVKDLLERGAGNINFKGGNESAVLGREVTCSARPAWAPSWSSPNGELGETHLRAAHCADGHQVLRRGSSALATSLKTDTSGWSPLHACCAETSPQHYNCAVELLGSKQDPNARTNTGRTPLHVAACALDAGPRSGVYDVIPLLVSHGADMEAQDGDGLRPVHFAAKAGQHVALLALLTAGADPYPLTRRGWNALHYSMAGGHVDATRLLTYWDSDCGALGSQINSAGALPLDLGRTDEICSATPTIWEAAALGLSEKVSHACLESSRSAEDRTGKPWACPGANKKTPGLGFTPLHACVAGLAAITKGLDVSRPCSPTRSRWSREGGARFVPRPSLYARISRERVRPSRRCNRNMFPREHADATCQRRDHLGVCRALLFALSDVDALDDRCRTPLSLAAASGDVEVVEMLLEAGADPRASDTDGNTPAHFALAYANAEIAAVLVKNGADLETCNKDDNNPQEVAGLCAGVAPCESDASSCGRH